MRSSCLKIKAMLSVKSDSPQWDSPWLWWRWEGGDWQKGQEAGWYKQEIYYSLYEFIRSYLTRRRKRWLERTRNCWRRKRRRTQDCSGKNWAFGKGVIAIFTMRNESLSNSFGSFQLDHFTQFLIFCPELWNACVVSPQRQMLALRKVFNRKCLITPNFLELKEPEMNKLDICNQNHEKETQEKVQQSWQKKPRTSWRNHRFQAPSLLPLLVRILVIMMKWRKKEMKCLKANIFLVHWSCLFLW